MKRILHVAVVTLVGVVVAAPGGAAPPKRAGDYTFDGFKLGDEYAAKVMRRAPYDQPCDDDPIDKKARRFMVYGALPCRDRTFPDQTTVMFYLRYSEDKPLQQPIQADSILSSFGTMGLRPAPVGMFCAISSGNQVDDTGVPLIVIFPVCSGKLKELFFQPAAIQPIGQRIQAAAVA